LPDQARLAHAAHDHAARAVQQQLDRRTESGIESAGDIVERFGLQFQNFAGFAELIELGVGDQLFCRRHDRSSLRGWGTAARPIGVFWPSAQGGPGPVRR
jgi:hypothetical protein